MLAAAAVVFASLALGKALAAEWALIGFAVIAGAALIERRASHAIPPPPMNRPSQASVDQHLVDAIIDALPEPVVVLGEGGAVIAYNGPAAELAPALRRGEPASLALRMPELVDAIRQAGRTGRLQRVEFAERVPVERWNEAFVSPSIYNSAAGTRKLVIVAIHDRTPLHRAEQMRVDFVANASHELRTPLAAISGFIETLQGPARDDAAARLRFLDIMRTQATRMARVIEDLLSLSRIEHNVHIRPQTPTDVDAIVRQVVDSLQVLMRERGVEVKIDGPPAPLIVPGDRDELVRVFENLIENALKYGAAGRRVEISMRSEVEADGAAEQVVVAVRDFGPGIAPEHLPRLTERFYRADVADSRAQGGTGLGLAIVKHILARHGGRLSIESTPGNGATFTVRLPTWPSSTGQP